MCFKGIMAGSYGIGAAGDLQIIMAGDPVIRTVDSQSAGTIEGQILFGEDDRIRIGIAISCKCTGDGETVVIEKGDKYFVSCFDIDHRRTVIGDTGIVQHNLYLGGIIRFYGNCDIGSCTGDDIDTFFRNGNILPVTYRILHGI